MRRLAPDIAIGFILACALALALMTISPLRWADSMVYDTQMRWLHKHAPTALAQDVVVIGLDEAAFETIPEPYALWHRHLGDLLNGLAQAQPAVVGLAIPLPVRSYDFLVKGIDESLIQGIQHLRSQVPLVVGQPTGVGHALRPVASELMAALGPASIASLALCEDADGVVRHIGQDVCVGDSGAVSFSQAMAKALGRNAPASGLIDYATGGEISYLPVTTVLEWIRQNQHEKLKAKVQGHPVIIASLLPTDTRYRLPLSLTSWERGSPTAVADVVQVQALRSLLGRGFIEQPTTPVSLLLGFIGALVWFGRNSWIKFAAVVLFECAIIVGSAFALWHGHAVHAGNLLVVVLVVYLARLVWDSIRHYRERQQLKSAFAGHVSPQVMRAILSGKVQPDGDGERCQATIMFSDIRGFTSRSENATPEAMIALLNRFFAEASAAIHARGGAIDKFIGDGLMATFGVPQPLGTPEKNALEAAQDILIRVTRLNAELAAQGLAPIEIGIGIHSGEVLAGYVGSRKRRDFTIIGDPVNTASRLEGMTKSVGFPVVCSHEVASAVGFAGGLIDLGEQAVKGRSALHVWGWNPPLTQRLKIGAA
jgi:adenylate cyclase